MKFLSEQPEELSRRTLPRRVEEGVNSDNVPAEEEQADARSGQQDEGIDPPEAREVLIPPDRLANQVRSDTLKRMCVTRGLGKKYGPTPGCPGCATVGSHQQASHSDTCRDRMRAELKKSEEGREYLAGEQARVDATKHAQSSSSSHKRAVSEEWDRPPEKVLRRMGEEDVTKRQDITASSCSASRGPAIDVESRPSRKRVADVQTKDLEDNVQMDANESASPFPQAEEESSDGRMFIGKWEHDEWETHNQHLEDKVAGDEYLGLDESMDITTVNEQGVQWDFTHEEMEESSVQENSCGKIIFAKRSAPVCQLEIEIERELESHDTERERRRVAQSSSAQAVCLSYVQVAARRRSVLSASTHQGELPWQKDCVEEIQEMTGAKLMSFNQGCCSLSPTRRECVELSEKPTMLMTNCPAIAFTLNKRYPKHLERNEHRQSEHKNVEDLREDLSCGIQLQHKWSRHHKYHLASAHFNDLEKSVPPEESSDELLDQTWDDHTGASLDVKKVKEARQLEMEYKHKMHVFGKVPVAQCWDRQGAPESKMG